MSGVKRVKNVVTSHPWWHWFFVNEYDYDIQQIRTEEGKRKMIKTITYCCHLTNCQYEKNITTTWMEA